MSSLTGTVEGSPGGNPILRSETMLGVGAVSIVAVMLLPLPPFLLDLLLSFSISISLVVFLFALHIERPLEFSAFPSVLLLTTLMRLALNIAATRLILMRGNEGVEAAGHVIQAFGNFAVGGNPVIGITVFVLLLVINFVVITKGSGRIAEVAARFTLDSMPGKQMATDADLAAGLITEDEARKRRKGIEQEADFYGSMDGAGKFVRGDAVAGLLIMIVNIVGGLVVGMVQQNLSFQVAWRTYTSLTIGDGLVTQIPALLTSIAAGLVTTRASAGAPLGQALAKQLFGTQRTLYSAAMILGTLAVVPGMPHVAFLLLAAFLGGAGYTMRRKPETKAAAAVKPRTPEIERIEVESVLPIDLLEVEVGLELVPLIDTERGGPLMQRIAGLRKQIAQELGIIIPPVHMRDNLRLRPNEYRMLLSGNVIGRGELRTGRMLAINANPIPPQVQGENVVEPAFGLNGRWIKEADKQQAEMAGCTVVDPATVAATHFGELLSSYAHELLGRRETQDLLDIHGRNFGKVIEELIPTQLSLGQLIKVLRNLLRERISIRDFRTILEALADNAADSKDPDVLTEHVRQRLSKQLTAKYRAPDGNINALVLAPAIEQTFRRMQSTGPGSGVDPAELQRLTTAFEEVGKSSMSIADTPVVLCAADIRRTVSTFAQRYLPSIAVLSFREIDSKANVRTVGVIGQAQAELRHAV